MASWRPIRARGGRYYLRLDAYARSWMRRAYVSISEVMSNRTTSPSTDGCTRTLPPTQGGKPLEEDNAMFACSLITSRSIVHNPYSLPSGGQKPGTVARLRRSFRLKLMREPLFWAAAAFVGVVGLVGTFSWAALMVVWRGPEADILGVVSLLGVPGYVLAALSLLGVPALALEQGRASRALRIGRALLLAWLPLGLAVELAYLLSPLLYPSLWSPKGLPFPVLTVASVATTVLGSAALLSLGLAALLSGARRLGAMILILGVPGDLLFFSVHNALTGTNEISQQLAVTSTLLFGAELGVPEACLFALLGAMLLGGARSQAERRQAKENREKALCLYEVGLGKNDPSAVEEIASEDFRDPRRGATSLGKVGMRRFIADLWATYPALSVSVVTHAP